MIKKIVAYSFILIADFILLAHDTVAHHHHEAIAIEQSHTLPSHAEEEHHHHFPEHEHVQGDYFLITRQTVVLSPIFFKTLAKDINSSGHNGIDGLFIHISDFLYIYIPLEFKIPDRKNICFIPKTVTYTFGLRAPPFV